MEIEWALDRMQDLVILGGDGSHKEALDTIRKALGVGQKPTTNMPSTPVCPECWGHGTVYTNHYGGWVKCSACSGSGKPAHVG